MFEEQRGWQEGVSETNAEIERWTSSYQKIQNDLCGLENRLRAESHIEKHIREQLALSKALEQAARGSSHLATNTMPYYGNYGNSVEKTMEHKSYFEKYMEEQHSISKALKQVALGSSHLAASAARYHADHINSIEKAILEAANIIWSTESALYDSYTREQLALASTIPGFVQSCAIDPLGGMTHFERFVERAWDENEEATEGEPEIPDIITDAVAVLKEASKNDSKGAVNKIFSLRQRALKLAWTISMAVCANYVQKEVVSPINAAFKSTSAFEQAMDHGGKLAVVHKPDGEVVMLTPESDSLAAGRIDEGVHVLLLDGSKNGLRNIVYSFDDEGQPQKTGWIRSGSLKRVSLSENTLKINFVMAIVRYGQYLDDQDKNSER